MDNYFQGTIAQLRPDLVNPMKLSRYVAVTGTTDSLQFWEADMGMLRS